MPFQEPCDNFPKIMQLTWVAEWTPSPDVQLFLLCSCVRFVTTRKRAFYDLFSRARRHVSPFIGGPVRVPAVLL